MSQEQDIKEIIKQEYVKCFQDPAYFMRKYCYIQHPQRGRIPFNLYPFQAKVLQLFKENPFDIVLKSRQLGISTLAAAYALWLMLFYKDKNVLCIATKQETAKNMVTKVKFMYNSLPSWLREQNNDGTYKKPEEENKLTLRLNNGSQIKATSAASDSARSEAVSLLIIDEAAFIDGIEEIWASAQQTLATGGGAIVLSTPYGTGNWFHKMWVKAESGENNFLPIKLKWNLHPERDQAWRDRQDEDLGDPRLAAQECDCDFSTSGNTFFYQEHLDGFVSENLKDPLEMRGFDKGYWIFEHPSFNENYMILGDVARGDGSDFSTVQVIKTSNNEQVAEYKGQLGTSEFGSLLVQVATEYNNGLLVCENNNIGWGTVQKIIELGYKNLYYSPKSGNVEISSYLPNYEDMSKFVPGFSMTGATRPLALSRFREIINEKSTIIRSRRLHEEMKVFIWRNGKPEAQSGYNDDLVMPYAAGMYLRDTALKFKQQNLELTRAALNNISSTKQSPTSNQGGYINNNYVNPYSMKVNGQDESFKWLL